MKNEVWKDIPGLIGLYQVSSKGRVRSLDRIELRSGHRIRYKGKVLSTPKNYYGYDRVHLKGKVRLVHRLVAEAFIGPCPSGHEVCHGQEGKQNNSIENIRYGTRSDNQLDRRRDGTHITNNRKVQRSDGMIFDSIESAASFSSTYNSNISQVCKGRRKTAGGFMWRYLKS